MARRTRASAALAVETGRELSVLCNGDMLRILLPSLDAASFGSLRCLCTEVRDACSRELLVWLEDVERAAELYVTPRFKEALAFASSHQQYLKWLLFTSTLPMVDPSRFVQAVACAYHLLQAHLCRVQKLALSRRLRLAAAKDHPRLSSIDRCRMLHFAVRLGMFTENTDELKTLHRAATQAMAGITAAAAQEATAGNAAELSAGNAEAPVAEEVASVEGAAAHYTLAGFYTYHHKLADLGDTLEHACFHLDKALAMQRSLLGSRHVSTLCSELVRAQVLLLRSHSASVHESRERLHECRAMLETQLRLCDQLLSLRHPLAAKMLAVKARLCLKLRREDECEELQQRVLAMRLAALGMDHEDTHRSAMDVYARRRAAVLMRQHEPLSSPVFAAFATAISTCLEMVARAAAMPGEGFALSKSLQGMAQLCFGDLRWMCEAGVWPRAEAVARLREAAQTLTKLASTAPAESRGAFYNFSSMLLALADELAACPDWPLRQWPFQISHNLHHPPIYNIVPSLAQALPLVLTPGMAAHPLATALMLAHPQAFEGAWASLLLEQPAQQPPPNP